MPSGSVAGTGIAALRAEKAGDAAGGAAALLVAGEVIALVERPHSSTSVNAKASDALRRVLTPGK